MILYRKSAQLRMKRAAVPEPPFWFATAIAPYSARRAQPVAIDYLDLRASSSARLEVTVCDTVRDDLERSRRLDEPVLVDAAESAERFFRRGEEALGYCGEEGLAALHLISTRSELPAGNAPDSVVAIAAWPVDLGQLEILFSAARERRLRWGVAIPVIYPVTTNLSTLASLFELALGSGAAFFAALPIEMDATAKHAIAQSLAIGAEDDVYATLFHSNLEPLHVATERHIAALAAASGLFDFIPPPRWERRSNWNAATLLTLTASRMMAMEHETELAGTIARSARAVAEIDKPIERIAAAASLSIVQALDEVSVDILSDWVAGGQSPFVERINREWRLRRDAGM